VTSRRIGEPLSTTITDLVPPLNPDYLTEIKPRTTCLSPDRITGALELINAKGARVCSERAICGSSAGNDSFEESNLAHLRCLEGLDARSAEILCLEDYRLIVGWQGTSCCRCQGCEQILEESRGCIERFEVTVGDSALRWNVDKYFLDGLDHLRGRLGMLHDCDGV